jgi:hypothetical protein
MSARIRPRISRTLARSRWREYECFLDQAASRGYSLVSLEDWVLGGAPSEGLTLVLRHDVDQAPRAALPMAEIERARGVRSTWYFRWRTADRRVIAHLRSAGCQVGLHYETLSRAAVRQGPGRDHDLDELIEPCRRLLTREIQAFAERDGPIRSICPHGDSRVPHVHNGRLVQGVEPEALGIEFDGNEAMRGRRLGHWLTDRSVAEGGWADGIDPSKLFESGVSPILGVVHPNNWNSGPALWANRVALGLRRNPDEPPL